MEYDKFDDDETWQLTPKGMALVSLKEVGLLEDNEMGQFNAFWILFENRLLNSNYVEFVEEDDDFDDEEYVREFEGSLMN